MKARTGTTTSSSRTTSEPRRAQASAAVHREPARPAGFDEEGDLLARLGSVHVRRSEDRDFEDLLRDMVLRSVTEREARAVILAGGSGAGKTTLVEHAVRSDPRLSLDGDRPGMLRVQVPSPCTLADLGTAIAIAAGQPVREGLKANSAWGIAMRTLRAKDIRFVWLDEVHNITWDSNRVQARRIRNTVKTAMINIRHRVGIVLSGDTSIVPFLCEDGHVARRADVFALAEIGKRRHRIVAETVRKLAAKARMTTPRDLQTRVVPRLVHAALGQFGTAVEMTRITIVRASRERDASGAPPTELTLEHFATNWARSTGADAVANPFVSPRWKEVDCAALVGRIRSRQTAGPRRQGKGG